MWYCYVIRQVDKFKHLGMIAENLDEIDCFIKQVTKLHNDVDFLFLIERKNKQNENNTSNYPLENSSF